MCWAIVFMASACSGSQVGSTDSDYAKWVDAVAVDTMRDGLVPSVSIAVARGETVVLEKTYGRADIENDVPAGNNTIYRIASVTKQFTAAAILRLVEQGRVDLDADITRYVSEFHGRGTRITIRQLLNHTSGIRNLTDAPGFASKERLDLADAEALAIFQDEPRDFQPGENFLYNNSGFYLLAMVIERVSGLSIEDYLHRSLFEPLGLKSTSVCDDARIVRHRAQGYIVSSGQLLNAPFVSKGLPKGGGNLCSTAADLVLWAQALATGKVVTPESFALMTTPGTLADGRAVGYGLGLFLSEFEGRPEVFHGGDFGSFTSFLAWYPADNVTIAVLQNSGAAPAFDGFLARRLIRRFLQRPEPALSAAAPDDNELNRVVGTYRIGTASIDVRRATSDLVVASANVWHLWEHTFRGQGSGAFVSVRDPEVRLRFGGDGAHAQTLSLTLHGRAFGDATYQDGRK